MHKQVKKSIGAPRGLCIGNNVLVLEPIESKILVDSSCLSAWWRHIKALY